MATVNDINMTCMCVRTPALQDCVAFFDGVTDEEWAQLRSLGVRREALAEGALCSGEMGDGVITLDAAPAFWSLLRAVERVRARH